VAQPVIACNPKLRGRQSFQSAWYPYYPGFSEGFARHALASASLRDGEWVLDPWNGSGTTISAAASLGLNARGYDLNPVMVLVAKARCLDASEYSSLKPLTSELLRQAKRSYDVDPDDPVSAWLHPASVAAVRGIEAAVQRLLIDDRLYANLRDRGVDGVSDLAAFFYVALFRTIRQVLHPFLTSNPTWIKRPRSGRSRLRPAATSVREIFRANLAKMLPSGPIEPNSAARAERAISVASSERLPLANDSVSYVLASPPYCTRIDYAVATSPELAVLGYAFDSEFDELRRQLIGTPTVPSAVPEIASDLGGACLRFLEALSRHDSKASSTYYYKNHLQYFLSIAASLSEIRRVLKPGGRCILVAQDSYYKDLHNDLPTILAEMAALRGLRLRDRRNFPLSRTLAGINPGAHGYRKSFSAVESVLVFGALAPTSRASRTHLPYRRANR
jgi:SAM-dependent methyltransferase